MSSAADPDRIERSIIISAPRERVWRALSSAEEFGKWFGADLKGQHFSPGERARGRVTQPGYEHSFFDVLIDRVEPPNVLAFRWHPYSDQANLEDAAECPTLVVLTLSDAPDAGTVLTVVESGFSTMRARRRMQAWVTNSRGWEVQLSNVSRHVCA